MWTDGYKYTGEAKRPDNCSRGLGGWPEDWLWRILLQERRQLQRPGKNPSLFSSFNHYFQFVKGQFHGLGVYSWANGASYEGDHVKDQRTGFGVMTYPDGAAFSGIWEDGVHKEFRESRDSLPTTTTTRPLTTPAAAVTTTEPATTTTTTEETTTKKRRARKKKKGTKRRGSTRRRKPTRSGTVPKRRSGQRRRSGPRRKPATQT